MRTGGSGTYEGGWGARVNPVTFVLAAGRSLLAGSPEDVAQAAAIAGALIAALACWALLGLRRAERAGI